ncbi:HNH endonuclease [Shouchella clausii]|nr:HNH endonuclease signature motif containing protein [Shouchella clausii]
MYEIHHIIPRAYGGDHSFVNLIPLLVSDHRKVSYWWASY